MKKLIFLSILTCVLIAALSVSMVKAAGFVYVSPTGNDTNDCLTAVTACATIQAAIDKAVPGDTVNIDAGTYAGNINITKSLNLSGAAGATVAGSGGTAVTISADGVSISGLTVTNPSGKSGIYAADHSNLTISSNTITNVGSTDATSGTNLGVGVISSAATVDSITISNNQISQIVGGSGKSAEAIAVGWSSGSMDVTNLLIQGNTISNVTSDTSVWPTGHGAYGIIINHGTSTTGKTVAPQILNNNISNMEGLWAHGVGLEGNTPNAVVQGNSIDNLVDHKSPADTDAAGVEVEDNASANTVTISGNSFTNVLLGVRNATTLAVNAQGNYWGDANPSDNVYSPGGGAIDYSPWLEAAPGTSPMTWGTNDSIQDAVNAAAAGDTINVAAGTYTEQVAVVAKDNLTINGVGAGSTTIQSPASLATEFTTSTANKPIVYVNGSTGDAIQNLTVNGAGLGNSNNRFEGIAFYNAGGTVQNTVITGVRETPLSGSQHGVALYAYNADAVARSLSVSNNVINDYQKTGMALNGQNLTATVTGNTVTGAGPTSLNAQNGIQIGFGASGTINGNSVSGDFWTGTYGGSNDPASDPAADGAAGILLYEAGNATATNNSLTGNQFGVWSVGSSSVNVNGNTIGGAVHTGSGYPTGIAVWTTDQWGSAEVGTTGSITGNTIATLDYGLQVLDYTAGGAAPGVVAHSNSITGCSLYGALSNSALNAEGNWWGSASGPSGTGPGAGSPVSANVDYSPWLEATPGTSPMTWGTNDSIQGAVNAASAGDTINVSPGTYTENVTIDKTLNLAGAGAGSTLVQPAVSIPNPCSGSTLCGSATAASNIILVQANNVVIHDMTLNGDNPSLTSGIVQNGADLDARNGIVDNYYAGVYNGLTVYNTTVQNIYLRGIYAASGQTGFNFHDNTVTNVSADPSSIAVFAYNSSGTMANNSVSYANDALSANHSKGIQFLNNTVTNSASGVHTDNAGDGGGVADLIQDNNVSDCSTGGYGVWTFVPYIAPAVNHNTVTNCAVGLSAWGGSFAPSPTVTTSFTNNTVNGPAGAAGSVGAYITTDTIGWGYTDVAVDFTGNVIKNNETGVYLTADAQTWNPSYTSQTITANFSNNEIDGNTKGLDKGTGGTINANAINNWWGSASGPYNATSNATGTGNSIVDGVPFIPWLGMAPISPTVAYVAPAGEVNVGNPVITATASAGASSSLSASLNLAGQLNPANPFDINVWNFSCTVSGSAVDCPTSGLPEGVYTATVSVTDGNGQISDATGNFNIVDNAAPVTTDNAPAGWQNTDVTVTLTCTDAVSGCAATTYEVDGGATQTGNSVTLTAEGVHTITYRSTDNVGHVELDKTATVSIDKTAPVTTDNAPAGWQNSDVTVALSCTDALSGCASTTYQVDGGAVQTGNTVSITTDGVHTITYSSTDNAGNTETAKTATVSLDKTAPVTTDNAPGSWQNSDVTVTLSCTDATSGCAVTTYEVDAGVTQVGNSVSITTDGVHNITYRSTDNAGNTEATKTATVSLDKTAPVTTDNAPGSWQNSDVTVTLSCTDATSGCASTTYEVDGGTTQTGNSVSITTDGVHTITYRSTDNAGNVEATRTATVSLDKTAPMVTYTGPSGTTYDYVGSITGTVTDPAPSSGSLTATLSLNGGAPTACTITGGNIDCPTPGLANGTYSAVISVRDQAGNTGTASGSFTYAAHGKPDLSVSVSKVYWASYPDYLAGKLSVDYLLANNSTGLSAMNVTIAGVVNTNSVLGLTATPLTVGNIAAGTTAPFTLAYGLPTGVTSFKTSIYATAADPTGTVYAYPGPYPGS